MDILDEVQERLRDPRHSDHVSRATETELPLEHCYQMDLSYVRDCKWGAYDWLESDEARQVLPQYRGQCLLISKDGVVGHGVCWDEAYEMARRKGLSRQETLELRMEKTLVGL